MSEPALALVWCHVLGTEAGPTNRLSQHTQTHNHHSAKLGLPPLGIGQRKKAASIPNSWPFKEQLLEELAQAKRRMEEEKQRNKEEAALRRKQALLGTDVAALVKQAEARGQAFDQQRQGDGVAGATAGGASKYVGGLKMHPNLNPQNLTPDTTPTTQ